MESALVTIIMPAYNASSFIEEAIQSVMDQTYPQWELIIINDGSTDNTEKKIRQFTDARIQYYFQSNRGVSAARNLGLQHMKGKFLCFLDADDVLPPGSIEARLKPMVNRDVTFVDGRVEVFDSARSNILKVWTPSFTGNPLKNLIRLQDNCFFGPTWMIRVVPGVTYQFDQELTHGEDLYFYITIASSGIYRFVEETILQYRKSARSSMSNLDGLAKGYSALRKKISFNLADRIIFEFKTRKIMFLSFFRMGMVFKALRFLIIGR